MTREDLIESVKKKYVHADVATIEAVLKTLRENDTDSYLRDQPSPVPDTTTGQNAESLQHPLKFVGENLSPDEYRKLSFDERGTLTERLKERNLQWLDEKFAASHAAWLMVLDGEVIASGDSLHTYPRQEQIHEIISRYGKQPFTFINDLFVAVEESHPHWHPTIYRNDFYPTVSITLRTGIRLCRYYRRL